MNKQLIAQLLKMDEVAFRLLDLHMNISKKVRNMQVEFKLTDSQLCAELKLDSKKLKSWKNACFVFTLRDVAIVESTYLRLNLKAIEKEKEHVIFETPIGLKKEAELNQKEQGAKTGLMENGYAVIYTYGKLEPKQLVTDTGKMQVPDGRDESGKIKLRDPKVGDWIGGSENIVFIGSEQDCNDKVAAGKI